MHLKKQTEKCEKSAQTVNIVDKMSKKNIKTQKTSYEKWPKINKKSHFILTSPKKSDNVKAYERKIPKKESGSMLNDEICKLRERLNESIRKGENYEKIYQLSVELDDLIAEYYKVKICNK